MYTLYIQIIYVINNLLNQTVFLPRLYGRRRRFLVTFPPAGLGGVYSCCRSSVSGVPKGAEFSGKSSARGDSDTTVGVSGVPDVRLRLIGDGVRYITRRVFFGGGVNAISVDVSLLVGDGATIVDVSDDLRLLPGIYII